MKKTLIIIVTGIALLISACSSNSGKNVGSSDDLTKGFTLVNIKSALEEYINYRLWFYPSKVAGNSSEFDAYIDQTFQAEVRHYSSSSQTVYATLNKAERLAVFKLEKGIVYCDGIVEKDQAQWPKGSYEIIGEISVKVQQPHKPNYGTSSQKDQMIAVIETRIKDSLKDLSSGQDGTKWSNTKVYLVDFYEYEQGISVWYVREDGYIWYAPILLVEKNEEFEAEGLKGFELKNIHALDQYDPGRFMFEKQTNDAVKQFTWKNGELIVDN